MISNTDKELRTPIRFGVIKLCSILVSSAMFFPDFLYGFSANTVKSCQAVAAADICKSRHRAIAEAYDHAYRLHEIAAHLGVHYGTVSRRLK